MTERDHRIVSYMDGVERLLAADAKMRERLGDGFAGIQIRVDEQGRRVFTVTERDLSYVLAKFADEMVERGFAEATRPSGLTDGEKDADLPSPVTVSPVAAQLVGEDVDKATIVLRSLSDLTHTRYNCDCQVGGPDARSIDADYLAHTARQARDLILALLGRTEETGVLTGDAAKIALAAEALDRIDAVANRMRHAEKQVEELATEDDDPVELARRYRRAGVRLDS